MQKLSFLADDGIFVMLNDGGCKAITEALDG